MVLAKSASTVDLAGLDMESTMRSATRSRLLVRSIPGMQTSDGAGVKLRRSIGSGQDNRLDPFLKLDEFFVVTCLNPHWNLHG